MNLDKIFIKNPEPLIKKFSFDIPAIKFRRKFNINKLSIAKLYICGLGYGYYYINGKKITEDRFIAPVSDYRKTIWYNEYDVTSLLYNGENIFCAILGNGFLNENFDSAWELNKAEWRDSPKLFCTLIVDGEIIFSSDNNFKCSKDKCIYFNQLRSGEYWNYNFKEDWLEYNYNDSLWSIPIVDNPSKTGVLRLCNCQPIRECERITTKKIIKKKDKYIFDIGQNISGYILLKGKFRKNTTISIFYAEEIDENYNTMLNDTDVINHLNIYAKSVPFQTDKIICDGNYIEWSPMFTYHGFRYVEISGLDEEPNKDMVTGIFVHQDIERISSFSCSNEILNKIYKNGINSTYSNMFYCLTDCPTREKLGWLNDSAASVEQVLLNFDSELLLKKWIIDILDAMDENGDIPGIAPSNDWGYHCGGVCSIGLAEIPYQVYLKTQDKNVVKTTLPYIEKYYKFFENKIKNDCSGYWLGDWTGASLKETPVTLIEKFIALRFVKSIICFRNVLNKPVLRYEDKLLSLRDEIEKKFLNNNKSIHDNYTAISMMIVENIGDRKVLKRQLEDLYLRNPKLDVGMVGIQYIYKACSIIERGDIAVNLLTNSQSFFKKWIDEGATTLYETFDENPPTISKNHHMFSNVIGWFFTGLLGICKDENNGYNNITIKIDKSIDLDFIRGELKLKEGSLLVEISKQQDKKVLHIQINGNILVNYKNKRLYGDNIFYL